MGVPATPIDDNGFRLTAREMEPYLKNRRVLGLGEVMDTKAVITGDLTQIDLPRDQKSGLRQATELLKDIEGIGICRLTNQDVVRHPLVQKIVEAYEKNGRTGNESMDRMGGHTAYRSNFKRKCR